MSADFADGTKTTTRTWPYVIYSREVRGGFPVSDQDRGMRMPKERTERSDRERAGRETYEGIGSDGVIERGGDDRRGEATVEQGRLSIDCTIVDDGATGRRVVIRPESRLLVISDGLVRHHGVYADLFGEMVVETKSWRNE